MKIPKYALAKIKDSRERIDQEFTHIWGLLPSSEERDTVMFHLMSAKREITKWIKETEESK